LIESFNEICDNFSPNALYTIIVDEPHSVGTSTDNDPPVSGFGYIFIKSALPTSAGKHIPWLFL
jgi:hypothetical protein